MLRFVTNHRYKKFARTGHPSGPTKFSFFFLVRCRRGDGSAARSESRRGRGELGADVGCSLAKKRASRLENAKIKRYRSTHTSSYIIALTSSSPVDTCSAFFFCKSRKNSGFPCTIRTSDPSSFAGTDCATYPSTSAPVRGHHDLATMAGNPCKQISACCKSSSMHVGCPDEYAFQSWWRHHSAFRRQRRAISHGCGAGSILRCRLPAAARASP